MEAPLYEVVYFGGNKRDRWLKLSDATAQAKDLTEAYQAGRYGYDPKPMIYKIERIA